MIARHFYFRLKPFLPWTIRIALRRIAAKRQLRRCATEWPINESAATPPAAWPGWPGGAQFAFVLTNDVESAAGLERCQRLATYERELGFRSCFNLIPEASYAAPESLRRELEQAGFEVGVHDLYHDGQLFRSRRRFAANAARINQYLAAWGAVGFRAGFMLRELDWLHDLDIQWDSSTFDTDPFEPQSGGTGTIFPFWLAQRSAPDPHNGNGSPATGRGGYVELPYTLPQDSTLFLLLREQTPAIWLQKLAWIARHGGMALVNVHPDYLQFPGDPPSPRKYPLAHYLTLLEHVRAAYAGRYWQPLPREVATFVTTLPERPRPRRRRRIGMVTYSFYESDNRVTRYAEALAQRGDHVEVFALRRSGEMPRAEVINDVAVFRIQDRFGKNERSRLAFLLPVLRFLVCASWWVTRRHARERYDLLHVHNMPDFLVFAAWLPRLTRTPVVLDIHDIVPEFYGSKFRGGESWTTDVLRLIERRSASFASHIIVSNHLWLEKYRERTRSNGKCSVFINHVDTRIFHPQPRTRADGRIVILFPGGLQWHQGLDIALRAFTRVSREMPEAEFHIYGEGNMKSELVALASTLGFNGRVKFFEPVRVKEIAAVMANADVGIVPKRADSFGNEAYSTKIMEFMSLGVPVVVSRTRIDQYYFDDSVVQFFESGNPDALAEALLTILRDAAARQRLTANGLAYSREHCWETRQRDYLELLDGLTPTRS